MAEERRHRSQKVYVDGNTVRKEVHRDRPQKRPQQQVKRQVSKNVRRNQQKALYVDLPYVAVLTVAVVVTLFVCANYIHIQSSITARIHNIETLEQSLEQYQIDNDALRTRIHTYVDLDYVYRVATEELGMVYAGKSQVIQYHRTEREYVRQNEDIPKH